MNILITGSNGFIGKNLNYYINKKHNLFNIIKKNIKYNNLKNKIIGDLSNYESTQIITKYIFKKKISIDLIIHTAGKLFNEKSKYEDFNTNIQISNNLCILIRKLKCKKLINFSSISVYPYENGLFNEKSLCNPKKNNDYLYGLSKLLSEKIFDKNLNDTNCKIINLRVSQIYGKYMKQNGIIPVMKKELKKDNKITVYGNGKRSINIISVPYLINVLSKILYYNKNDTFNLGEENISLYNLAKRIIKQSKYKNAKILKKDSGKKEKFILDTSKIENLLK